MKVISLLMLFLVSTGSVVACDATADYLTEKQNIAASKRFKKQWKVGKRIVTEYMNRKYGNRGWRFQGRQGFTLKHNIRPKIIIDNHYRNMSFIVLYEKVGRSNPWYEDDSKIQFFAEYKNIGKTISEITLPHPGRLMAWSKLHRLWVVQRYSNAKGGTEIIVNKTPWEYFVTHCGYGNGVVSR